MTINKLSNEIRLKYINDNEYNLTQLAIQNKIRLGPGVLFIDLDSISKNENNELKVMYYTTGYMAKYPQLKLLAKLSSDNKSKNAVIFSYNDENGKSCIIEKQLV